MEAAVASQYAFRRARLSPATEDGAQRTLHRAPAALDDVCIDLCGAYVGVAQLLLHRTDVRAALEQVRGERVAQRVTARRALDADLAQSPAHRPLDPVSPM